MPNTPVKVLHLIHSVNPATGGPIEGILRSAEVWESHGKGVRHIASLDSPTASWVSTCPLKVFPLGWRSPSYEKWLRRLPWLRYGYSPHLVPWLKENVAGYDAVIVNGLWNYITLGARLGLSGSRVPYFVFPHGMLDPWFKLTSSFKHFAKQGFWWISEGPLLRDATAVLFTTEDEQQLARDAFWPYRVTGKVLGYGASEVQGDASAQIAAFRESVPSLGLRPFLLFLSRIHPKKGCDLLINAFAEHAGSFPDIDLVIAGPDQVGWRADLERLALARGIGHRLHWVGMLRGDVKWGAFRACDAFILPSHQENFGIVVAEAMACSKPVLITNKVNIWREVLACHAGLVADDDQAGVTMMLDNFLTLDAGARQRMGRAARVGFDAYFNIEDSAMRLLELVQRAVAENDLARR